MKNSVRQKYTDRGTDGVLWGHLTNYETNYLLGFSHEDSMHGCGIAKRWVDSLKGTKHHEELL